MKTFVVRFIVIRTSVIYISRKHIAAIAVGMAIDLTEYTLRAACVVAIGCFL